MDDARGTRQGYGQVLLANDLSVDIVLRQLRCDGWEGRSILRKAPELTLDHTK